MRRFLAVPCAVFAAMLPLSASAGSTPFGATGDAPDPLQPLVGSTITQRTGLWDGHNRGWFGSYPQDWDGDGDMDVLMAPHGGTRFFMQNDGTGSFTEIFHRTIPPDDRHGCAWGDPNADGRPDLYCTIGAGHGTQRKANELFMQQPDGTFVDRAKRMGVDDPWGRGREAGWLDANGDAWPDLYVSNQYPRQDHHSSRNRLFLGVDGTRFVRAVHGGVDINGGSAINVHGCVVTQDFTGDGRDDIITCGSTGLRVFHRASGGGAMFVERTVHDRVRPGIWYQADLADMDGDGKLDLVGATDVGLVVQFRLRNTFAAGWVKPFGDARQVAVGDVDGDGDPDLYLVRAYGPDVLLVNHGGGRDFTPAHLPVFAHGIGDSASAVDIDQDGRDEIIVTHGGEHHKGPVQVLTFASAA